jgi:hypothetical protein
MSSLLEQLQLAFDNTFDLTHASIGGTNMHLTDVLTNDSFGRLDDDLEDATFEFLFEE